MTTIDLTLVPLRSGLLAGHETTTTVLVRARAPAAAGGESRPRRSLNIALVIDRSGSMAGRPLDEAKRCAEFVVNGLASTDQVSIVTYCDQVDVLAPSQQVGDRQQLIRAIRRISARGSTALYDGWRLGADQALLGHSRGELSRVLLLSDGNANCGLTSAEGIATKVAAVAAQGVSTSTYGLGHHFNEDLMMAMARAGHGNGYYGESAEDLMDPFREELDLLNALCARELSLSLNCPEGVGLRMMNDYPQVGDGCWRLPDLAFGGEAWALAEIRIPTKLMPLRGRGEVEVLRAGLKFRSIEGEDRSPAASRLVLPFLPAGAFEALASNESVRARMQELRAADLQDQARTAARRQEWEVVNNVLDAARRESANNPWLLQSLDALTRYARQRDTERLSKEAYFKSRRLRSRLVDPNESTHLYNSVSEAAKPRFLRRKGEEGKRLDR